MSPSPFRAVLVAPSKYRLQLCAVVLSCVLNIANAPISGTFDQRVLSAHNAARERLGQPPLHWNPHLAEVAVTRANQLIAAHVFQHAAESAMSPQGENIWGGSTGYYSLEDMVDAWANERQYFKNGIFPDNSTTGKIEDVGHFTQLAWRNTTAVGCGLARDAEYDILVCRYDPAGNFSGERPF